MKHITLFAGVLLAGTTFAQSKLNVPSATPKQNTTFSRGKMSGQPGSIEKSPGDVIWSNNFSYIGQWTSTVNPSATPDATHGWAIGTGILPWAFSSPINSTSDGAYALMQNGDPTVANGTGADAVWTGKQYFLTYDSVFNLSTFSDVLFTFQEYGAQFIEMQTVEASVDNGVSWIQIGSNADLPNYTAAGGSAYTNPTMRSYNVTNALNGQSLAAVKFRFKVEWPSTAGANDGIMYGWFVDDVALVEGNPNDMKLGTVWPFTGTLNNVYTKFPKSQAGGANAVTTVAGWVENVGSATENATLTATSGSYTSTATATIPGFDEDSLVVSAPFTIPTTAGVNNIMAAVTATPTLSNTGDDSKTFPFEVTNDIMAVDGFTGATSSMDGYFVAFSSQNAGDPTGIGTIFEVFENGIIGGVQVGVGNVGTSSQADYIGQTFNVVVLDVTQDPAVIIQTSSDDHAIVANDFGKLITIEFDQPIDVTAGQQLMVLATSFISTVDAGGAPIAFSGFIPAGSTFGVNGSDFANDLVSLASDDATPDIVEAPVVRLDFHSILGLNENISKSDVMVAPNPFTNETSVNFNLKADSEVSLVVTDMAGRQVVNIPAKNMSQGNNTISIDGSQLQAGMYTYTLTAGTNVVTDRIVKK